MSAKPTVLALMPPSTFDRMFREAELSALRERVELAGPFGRMEDVPEQGRAKATIALTGWGTHRLDSAALANLPALKFIAYSAGSVKGIVTDAVYERGIRVTTAAGCNAVPVAQFTVMAMASMLKQIPFIAGAYARGDREEIQRRRGQLRELQDMHIGLIGASRVGREVIKLLKPYPKLTIKVYDPYLTAEAAAELAVQSVSLDECCGCEIVSVHAPALPQTRHMLNAQTLAKMPDHAVLINTSRGSLIDEAALIAELNRRPFYASLDVTDPEPPAADSPLRRHPNVVLTPHVAGAQKQAQQDMGGHAIQQIFRYLDGAALEDEVTHAMLPTQA